VLSNESRVAGRGMGPEPGVFLDMLLVLQQQISGALLRGCSSDALLTYVVFEKEAIISPVKLGRSYVSCIT
jgi:hypothetical protein